MTNRGREELEDRFWQQVRTNHLEVYAHGRWVKVDTVHQDYLNRIIEKHPGYEQPRYPGPPRPQSPLFAPKDRYNTPIPDIFDDDQTGTNLPRDTRHDKENYFDDLWRSFGR